MKIRIHIALVLAAVSAAVFSQEATFTGIRWERERIAPGLVWKSSHVLISDSSLQNLNLLVVNLRKRDIFLLYDPDKNIKTSIQADQAGATAAVNGGFFNIRDGGSAAYIKTGGRIIDADTSGKWKRSVNLNGSLLIRQGKEMLIRKAEPDSYYNADAQYSDILVAGPLLLHQGEIAELPNSSLVTTRHPRTAAGVKHGKKVILLTADGRTRDAEGLTLHQLSRLMLSLGCQDAMNLDGGGSTTMWIRGKPFSGVVNMPCDNKKFDHEGERNVSDILIIK